MDLIKLSKEINEKFWDYEIGDIQSFRVKTKGLSKPKSWNLFPNEPINENWTFHIGGRTELQFNLGNEDEGLRYGFAFSLEPSISLPDPSILYPKIRRLNYIIRTKPYLFSNLKMWIWENGCRTEIHSVEEIQEKDIKDKNFIFIGKVNENPDIKEILETLDSLYPIYKEVESSTSEILYDKNNDQEFIPKKFVFKKRKYSLPQQRNGSTISREINIQVRHSLIQKKLYDELVSKYGEDNVAVEHYYELNRIDVVVRDGEDLYFYEVKTGNTARDCIREAFGQLMDYTYFPNTENAKKIFIVGEAPYDVVCKKYIGFLKEKFNLPIDYMCVNI